MEEIRLDFYKFYMRLIAITLKSKGMFMTFNCIVVYCLKNSHSGMNYDNNAINGVSVGLNKDCSFERDQTFC